MLGLVLDEPTEHDHTLEISGLRFLIDRTLASHLERFLPVQVDFDERYWSGLRIKPNRSSTCC